MRRRIKRRKRIFNVSKTKFILLSLALVIILVTAILVRFNVFAISSIEISLENVGCADLEQIKNSSKLIRQNFLLLNSLKIENNLKNNFLCIRQVQVSRIFPNKVRLSVLGRQPALILTILADEASGSANTLEKFSEVQASASGEASSSAGMELFMDPNNPSNKDFVVDTEGVVYSNNIEQIYAPRVYAKGENLALGEKIEKNLINDTLKILEKIKSLSLDIMEVEIYSKDSLLINSMPKIIFLLNDKVDKQIASLQLIYNKAKIDGKTLEFIDLRFDKPVVKFAPKK